MVRPVFLFPPAVAVGLLLSLPCPGQVLNPSSLIVLPPQQNSSGVYFATNHPSGNHELPGAEVFLRDASGILHQLTTVSSGGDSVADYAISDDGSHLAYTTSRAQGVFIATTANGHIQHLPNPSGTDGGGIPARLHFTADGKSLVFNETFAPSNETPSWGWPIFSATLATGKTTLLTRGELNNSGQRVISDDGVILFESADPHSTIAEPQPPVNLYTIHLDGTDLKQLSTYAEGADSNVASAGSIDKAGSKIVYQLGIPYNFPLAGAVYRANGDGTGAVPLSASSQSCYSPTLSADGALVAFVCDTGSIFLASGSGAPDAKALSSFAYSSIDHLVLDETSNEVLFSSGPTSAFRLGELDAVFGIGLADRALDRVQFERFLMEVDNADLASYLSPVPGGIVTVQASNIRSNSFIQASNTPLPETLGTASLLVNGKPAPIFSVSPWEMSAQLPWDVPAGTSSFQLLFSDGAKSQLLEEKVALNSPWLEGFAANNNFGCQAAAYHAGTTQLADEAHPAKIGETVDLITSGLGLTNPLGPTGIATPTSPAYPITGKLTVYLNSTTSEVKSAALAPGTFGRYKVSVVVPTVSNPQVQITLQLNGGSLTSNSCIFYAQTQ
jgi:uncharacterized protein (TIGR03437 family)